MKLRHSPLLLALLPLAAQALDLTPTLSFRELEGFKIPVVLFNDAGTRIAFQPPANWQLSGGGPSLNLYPNETPDALVQIRVRARQMPQPGVVEDLEKWCRAQLPQDAAEPALENEAESPFTVDARPSRQFTYSYGARGRRFITAVAVVEWNERERLVLVVSAPANHFDATHEAAMRSMFSWDRQP